MQVEQVDVAAAGRAGDTMNSDGASVKHRAAAFEPREGSLILLAQTATRCAATLQVVDVAQVVLNERECSLHASPPLLQLGNRLRLACLGNTRGERGERLFERPLVTNDAVASAIGNTADGDRL